MSEGLRMLTVNVANGLMLENAEFLGVKYLDVLEPIDEPNETADEIIDRISDKLERLNDGFI